MWLGAGATIAYTFIGGFLAVSWTDTVQATLMIFALILTPIMVLIVVGGFDDVALSIAKVATEKGKDYSEYSGLFAGTTFLGIVSTAAWGLGYFGQPHILARFMAAENVQSLKNARRIGMTWMILCLGGAIAVGYFGIAYFGAKPEEIGALGGKDERIFYWPFRRCFLIRGLPALFFPLFSRRLCPRFLVSYWFAPARLPRIFTRAFCVRMRRRRNSCGWAV